MMKKNILLIATMLIYCVMANAQFTPAEITNANTLLSTTQTANLSTFATNINGELTLLINKNRTDFTNDKIMSDTSFYRFFRNKLSQIAYGKDQIPLGNSITVNPTSENTRLSANFMKELEHGAAIGAGTELDYSDNIAVAFKGKNFTPNTSLFLNGYCVFKSFVTYTLEESNYVNALKTNYLSGLNTKYTTMVNDYNAANLLLQNYKIQLDSLNNLCCDSSCCKCNKLIKIFSKQTADSINTIKFKQTSGKELPDQLLKEVELLRAYLSSSDLIAGERCGNENCKCRQLIEELKNARAEAEETVSKYKLIKDPNKLANFFLEEIKDSLYQIESNANISNYGMWMLGGQAKYTRENYKIFNAIDLTNYTIDDKFFNRCNGTVSLSYFFKREKYAFTHNLIPNLKWLKSFYVDFNYTMASDNSYANLEANSLNISRSVSQGDTTITFQLSEKKVRDISNTAWKTSTAHTLNLYTALGLTHNELIALTFKCKGYYTSFSKPEYTPQVGLAFKFIDTDDSKSYVALELFAAVNNAFEKNPAKPRAEKLLIGLNTKIPLKQILY